MFSHSCETQRRLVHCVRDVGARRFFLLPYAFACTCYVQTFRAVLTSFVSFFPSYSLFMRLSSVEEEKEEVEEEEAIAAGVAAETDVHVLRDVPETHTRPRTHTHTHTHAHTRTQRAKRIKSPIDTRGGTGGGGGATPSGAEPNDQTGITSPRD
uniref:Uncharacterized protein n=1 Tax=Sipha flava TaxID=143950 RepID=A0A2S2Q8B0_9HEMI